MTDQSDFCIDPAAISDEAIIAYAVGEGSERTTEHLQYCSFCRIKAAPLHEAAAFVLHEACPSTLTLGVLVQGLLSPQEALVVSAHVRSCASCSEEKARFEAFLTEPERASGLAAVAQGLRRILAQPMSPSVIGAVRGGATGLSRAYLAESAIIYLDIDPASALRRSNLITGQITEKSGEPESGAATLFKDGSQLTTAEVDALGYFDFPGVEGGSYSILITTDNLEIVIEPLVID